MSDSFSVTASEEQGKVPVTVFHIAGDIDVYTHEAFEQEATAAYEAGTRHLLLDMSKVGYVGSAGLRSFHQIFTMLRGDDPEEEAAMKRGLMDGSYKSPHLKLLNPNADVLHSLKTAGFDMFLEIHTNLKKAIASF